MNRLTALITAAAVIASPTALAATTAHAAPDSARKPAAYTVTAKANKQVVTVGEDVVKVRGKVTPRAAGDKVVLQQRLDGRKKWSVSGEVKIKRNGTFVATDKPSVPGTRQYRVVKPASDGVKKGTSAIVDVQVYAWQKLAQRARGANENIAVSSTALIGTRVYPYSFQPFTRGAPSFVEYTLGRLCTGLRTTYALSDSSATGASARITLAVDGVPTIDQVARRGPGRRVDHRPHRRVPAALPAGLQRESGQLPGRRHPGGPLHEVTPLITPGAPPTGVGGAPGVPSRCAPGRSAADRPGLHRSRDP